MRLVLYKSRSKIGVRTPKGLVVPMVTDGNTNITISEYVDRFIPPGRNVLRRNSLERIYDRLQNGNLRTGDIIAF